MATAIVSNEVRYTMPTRPRCTSWLSRGEYDVVEGPAADGSITVLAAIIEDRVDLHPSEFELAED